MGLGPRHIAEATGKRVRSESTLVTGDCERDGKQVASVNYGLLKPEPFKHNESFSF